MKVALSTLGEIQLISGDHLAARETLRYAVEVARQTYPVSPWPTVAVISQRRRASSWPAIRTGAQNGGAPARI